MMMSWIRCKCGNILYDITDNISYKGYIFSDRVFFDMYDFADEMIESTNPDREEAAMNFRRNVGGKSYIPSKEIFQCPVCGRVLIENTPGSYCSFLPEEEYYPKNLLDYGTNGSKTYFNRKKK